MTLTDQAHFQLQVGPLEHPGTWSVSKQHAVNRLPSARYRRPINFNMIHDGRNIIRLYP